MYDIDQTVKINHMLDFYQELLTDKQQTIMELYFREDYSLAEISEELSITRNAVHDHIKRTIKILENYEEKLNLVEKYNKRMELYQKLRHVSLLEQIDEIVKLLEDSE